MLSSSEFQRSLHHFDLSRIDVSLLVLFTTHLHTESKSSGSVQVVDSEMGLKAAHVSQKLRFCLCDAFDRKYTNAYTHAANSEGQRCTSTL